MHTIVSHLSTCHNIFIRLLYLGSKTTIINLITGKALKSEGSISVNGEIVDDLSK
jgi:ABC-type polysaccharide/polyol phosphate transport system ATPase subunit